jgi:hypothetical protein
MLDRFEGQIDVGEDSTWIGEHRHIRAVEDSNALPVFGTA